MDPHCRIGQPQLNCPKTVSKAKFYYNEVHKVLSVHHYLSTHTLNLSCTFEYHMDAYALLLKRTNFRHSELQSGVEKRLFEGSIVSVQTRARFIDPTKGSKIQLMERVD